MKPVEYRHAVNPDFCQEIINNFDKCEITYRKKKEYSFKEISMIENEHMSKLMEGLVRKADYFTTLFKSQNNLKVFPDRYGYEAVRVKRYDAADQDEFPWHADVMDWQSAKRFLVCMFYLNDNFIGGETDFGSEEKINYIITPEQGKIVLFTPFWDNPHRGRKVISGSKYIANVYLHLL
jgi:hypothetical protein